MKNDVKIEEELTCQFKIDMGNLANFDRSTQKSQNLHFNGLPLTKLYNVRAEKVQGSYVWWHWMLRQNLKENWLCFQKWHEEFGKYSPEHLKVSKLGLWWDYFIQSWKCMSLKFTGDLSVMTMKNDAKLGEELTSYFKIDLRNLTNFDPSTKKSGKFAL